MASGPESQLTSKILKRLRTLRHSWWVKIPGGRFLGGVPDILGCVTGVFVAIEVKAPETGHALTLLQAETIRKIENAGGRVGVAYSVKDAVEIAEGAFQ